MKALNIRMLIDIIAGARPNFMGVTPFIGALEERADALSTGPYGTAL
jgi:hypothetical protein